MPSARYDLSIGAARAGTLFVAGVATGWSVGEGRMSEPGSSQTG
jgi:hypothetical protein